MVIGRFSTPLIVVPVYDLFKPMNIICHTQTKALILQNFLSAIALYCHMMICYVKSVQGPVISPPSFKQLLVLPVQIVHELALSRHKLLSWVGVLAASFSNRASTLKLTKMLVQWPRGVCIHKRATKSLT